MNADETEEVFDFKPFFDMIVGVLFVLLILIASQMFFVRHDLSSTAEASAAAKREEELARQRMEGEISLFLERVTAALVRDGLRAEVARNGGRILVALRGDEGEGRAEQARAVARALAGPVACATDSGHGKAGCPVYNHMRVRAATLRLGAPATAPAQQAEGEAARLALLLAAQMLRSEPALFALKTREGTFVLSPQLVTGHKDTPAPQAGSGLTEQEQQLAIGFTFAPD